MRVCLAGQKSVFSLRHSALIHADRCCARGCPPADDGWHQGQKYATGKGRAVGFASSRFSVSNPWQTPARTTRPHISETQGRDFCAWMFLARSWLSSFQMAEDAGRVLAAQDTRKHRPRRRACLGIGERRMAGRHDLGMLAQRAASFSNPCCRRAVRGVADIKQT